MTMWKTIFAGTTALAIAGSTLAYAQQGPGKRDRGDHWRPSAQDMAAMGDARIAALKAGLKLTPEQEKNWPALETAMREMATQRSERFAARASAEKPKDPIERMSMRAQMMTERGTTLKKLADAAGPLYNSLDEAQKRRFTMLARFEGQRLGMGGHRGHHGKDHHRGPRGERGPDRGERGPDRGPMGPDGKKPQ